MTGPEGRWWYGAFGKTWLDRVFAGILLVALAPLMAVVGLLVRLSLGSPILFGQHRPGLGGRPFRLVKFRTMRDARDQSGRQLPDADRLTPVGQKLREWSVDELPELINVLRGEMSLVGPRPLLMEYLPRYTPEQARRHEVRPGLTGWAQVNGRNALSWEERFALDVWYVDHVSLMLDLRILARTILQVVRREGISHATHATMHEFRGTSPVTRDHRSDDKETAARGV
jgi:lipopolysaccharide/colanic/teichoic acid biosynthesis glycosyltransferase